MPFSRCMHYDEDGKPNTPRGCPKGDSCSFIHPSQAEWARAPISRKARAGPSSRNDSRGGSSRSFSGSRDEWNAPSTSTNTINVPESSNRWNTSDETTINTQGVSSWGAPSSTDNPSPWEASSSDASGAGWGQPSNGLGNNSGSLGGWGASSLEPSSWGAATGSTSTAGWGTTQNSAWGSSGDLSTTPSAGWGSSVNSSTIASWGPPADANQTTQDRGKGKEKAAKDIIMRETSPPRRRASPSRQDHQQSQSKKLDLPSTGTNMQWSQSPSESPMSPVSASRPLSAVPLPTRPRQSSVRPSPAQESLKKRALELAATKTAQETGKIYPHEDSSTESPGQKKYDGPKGRLLLFTDLISHMQDLVISEIFLRRAEVEDEQWKRTQNSEIYARSSPLTRSALDSHRQAFKDKVFAASKSRDNALRALLNLPDFIPQSKVNIDAEATKNVVASYTAELREWLMELQLHKRLLIEKRTKEESKALQLKATSKRAPAQSRESTPPTAAELLKRGNWTWKELKDAVTMLEQQMDATSEQVYSGMCIRFPPSELDQKIAEKAAHLQTEEVESTIDVGAQSAESSLQSILKAGDDLRARAVDAATLYNKLHALEAEIEVLVAEKTKMDEICAQAEKQFQKFDESNKAQETKIEELTHQLQTLHLHKRPSLKPINPATSPPVPVKIDQLVEYIRPIVLQKMEADMKPFFAMMRQRVSENQDEVAKELEQLVKPVVDMTEEICQKVMSMNLAQAATQVSG